MIRDIEPAPAARGPAVRQSDAPVTAGTGFPRSWYLLCRSAEVGRARILSTDFLGAPVVLFRDAAGRPHALAAHCAHLGAHLARGRVVDGCLECPLHHWQWDGGGACRGPAGHARQPSFPVVEKHGAVFVFNGPEVMFDPPALADDADVRTSVGRPVTIACPWEALIANGFDVQHLEAVHGRALREPAVVDRPDRWTIRLSFISRVTGRGIADRAMKWISGNTIRVRLTCRGGTILTVESEAGRSRSRLMLGVLPIDGNATRIMPIFAVPRQGFAGSEIARLAVTRWLFTSFLKKDVGVLAGMRWPPQTPDYLDRDPSPAATPLKRIMAFLDSLPCAASSREEEP